MTETVLACPLCNGALELRKDRTYTFRFKAKAHVLHGLERWVCPACDIGVSGSDTAARNKVAIRDFERSIAGEMAPGDILELREKYRLSQEQAMRIFKTARRAFSKWERGEVAPVASVARMLRLALDEPEYMRMMVEKAGEEVDIPPPPKTVSHAEYSILKEQFARSLREDHVRRQEAYEAGRRAGLMRKQYNVTIKSLGGIVWAEGTDSDRSERILQEPMRWQRENQQQIRLQ